MSGRDFSQSGAVFEHPPPEWAASCVTSGSVLVGQLVGFKDTHPLVIYPGQPGAAAIEARATLDLHAEHVGREVVLAFEAGEPLRPIVIGCMREPSGWSLDKPAQVEVDADGQRLVVSARQQLVLRCGRASITLTRAGKILIDGAYVQVVSSGANRIKGGSVQIN